MKIKTNEACLFFGVGLDLEDYLRDGPAAVVDEFAVKAERIPQ